MVRRRYKVEFEVEGEALADDMSLTKDNIKEILMFDFDMSKGLDYYSNRGIDTSVSKLKIWGVMKNSS